MARKLMFWKERYVKSKRGKSRRRGLVRGARLRFESLEERAMLSLSPGSLDTTFDLDGVLIGSWAAGAHSRINAIATQEDGKIVVAGTITPDPINSARTDAVVARFNPDGSLDTTFGVDGPDADTDPDGFITFNFSTSISAQSPLHDVTIDHLGRILVVGTGPNASNVGSWTVARLTPDGQLDTSFGSGGKVVTSWTLGPSNVSGEANGVAVQPDGKVVVVGDVRFASFAGDSDFGVVRYNADGTLDNTFGSGGRVTTDFFFRRDIATKVAIQSDGHIVVVGNATTGTVNSDDFAIARYTPAGALDATFGVGGKVTTNVNPGAQDFANSVAIQADGRIVVGGTSEVFSNRDFVIARYLAGGLLDVTFNPGGVNSVAGTQRINFDLIDDNGQMVVQPDGQYVIGGMVDAVFNSNNNRFGLARVVNNHVTLTDGALDPDFGSGGQVTTPITNFVPGTISSARLQDMAMQPDGKIVAAGWLTLSSGQQQFVLARYESGLALQTASISGPAEVNEGATYTLDLSSSDPTTSGWTINWGDGEIQMLDGNPASVTHVYADDRLEPYTISASVTTASGTFEAGNTIDVTVHNVAPTVDAATFEVVENSANGTIVGTVTASDPGNDALTFSIVGGSGAAAFAIDEATGAITVANSELLDYETTPVLTLEVEVSDGDGGVDTALVTINLLNQASISGAVYLDVNQNGQFDAAEPGIEGVTIRLLDGAGNPVLDEFGQEIVAITTAGGFYLFEDLDPGVYQLLQVQPAEYLDGPEQLGSLGGVILGNDHMQLTLGRTDAYDYAFAELGQQANTGETAPTGFWQNKQGQELIISGGTALAQWLTATFPNIFGNALVGADGSDVARFYREELFKQQGKKVAKPPKVDAEFMAVALATFFTSRNLAGEVAAAYGFNVTDDGIGTKIVNVGNRGAAFGVANGSDRTILQLLLATNALTDQSNNISGFAHVYDTNGDGVISKTEQNLRSMAGELYAAIIESGSI